MHLWIDIKTNKTLDHHKKFLLKYEMKQLKVLAVRFYIVFYKTYQNCDDICSLNPLQAIDVIEWFFKCLVLENTESSQRTPDYVGNLNERHLNCRVYKIGTFK